MITDVWLGIVRLCCIMCDITYYVYNLLVVTDNTNN